MSHTDTYLIRCKVCGYECVQFHGWVFTTGKCNGITVPDGKGGTMLHDWEKVEETEADSIRAQLERGYE